MTTKTTRRTTFKGMTKALSAELEQIKSKFTVVFANLENDAKRVKDLRATSEELGAELAELEAAVS